MTTHVVCTVPEGDKYSYATKWGLPVVNPDWIHNSVKSRKFFSWERDYTYNSIESRKISLGTATGFSLKNVVS